ncbi:MAG: T9SS type A sorting domain-containing protein, partial [Opitutaceae bacterium]|nr:T9SS type A sorting domain-containing protein [Cytophagales bacterium]
DGWPTVGVNGQVPATTDIPKGSGSIKGIIDSDEFSVAPPLKLQWQWNHNPQNNYWSLTQKSGFLRLTNERTDPNVLHTTNTLTQRTFGPKCSGYVALDVSGMKDGDYAGLLALQNTYGFVGVKMSGTNKSIVMSTAKGFNTTPVESGNIGLNQNTVYLRIDFDFTNRTDKAYFFYSLNGTTWTAIGNTMQMNYDLTHFMGYRFGLFSYATKAAGGYADFDFFRVGANITEAQKSVVTSIEKDTEKEESAVYPNPFGVDGLRIHKEGDFNYQITDMRGLIVEKGMGKDLQSIGIQLTPGIYMISVENEHGGLVQKVVRQ